MVFRGGGGRLKDILPNVQNNVSRASSLFSTLPVQQTHKVIVENVFEQTCPSSVKLTIVRNISAVNRLNAIINAKI